MVDVDGVYVPQAYVKERLAAKKLCVSVETLRRWRRVGGGPVYRVHGPKLVAYGEHDLDAWSDARRRTSTSQTPEQAREAIAIISALHSEEA